MLVQNSESPFQNDPFIVAELSANHLGDFNRAMVLVDEAAKAGADAVKLQTYDIDDMLVRDQLITDGPWNGRSMKSLYKEAQTPFEWHKPLFDHIRDKGMVPFSSPFGIAAVDFLETLDCPIYKIASFELIDTPLIRKVAETGKRIIISTGMATEGEIDEAVKQSRSYGPRDITLLKCTSAYPASPSEANLNTMAAMYFRFKTHVGLSDHSLGIGIACASAGMGAKVIEKHLTLSREDGGPDAAFSLEPDEFSQMVTECRRAAAARGTICYGPKNQLSGFRRSLYYRYDMQPGEIITSTSLRTARPFAVVSPQMIDQFIGQTVTKPVKSGEPVTLESINAVHHANE